MLYYSEVGLSPYEVPNETALCIYISGCMNNCLNCHYPLLRKKDFGLLLIDNYKSIVDLYCSQCSCVCFLGEGANTKIEHAEYQVVVDYAKSVSLKTCLYCGRDTGIEPWMTMFDYVKLGSYRRELGSLDSINTNQVLLKKTKNGYKDITYLFWY